MTTGQKHLMICSANDTSKPTQLEKHKVPKFSHRLRPSSHTQEKGHCRWAMA
ncbi:hypothetical protein [Polynucleobacter necessarius]|uniref:hypothetical protein n=1 Tax=Polynucleobacter necessarius TaxID=576610 RepID=UPI0018D58C1B|nr:hypothetical protein [Polynucleobacter necessarius]